MRTYSLTVNGRQFAVQVLETGPDLVRVAVNGEELSVTVNGIETEDAHSEPLCSAGDAGAAAAAFRQAPPHSQCHPPSAGDAVTSPIPGQIIRILVREGDRVAAGQKLLVLEAMKLENKIVAHRNGLVKKILVRDGDTVSQGQQLVLIQ